MHGHTIDYLRRVYESELSKAQRAILTALALRPEASNGEACWLTDNELATLSSCARRTIITNRQPLEDAGWFVVIRDEHGQAGYQLSTEQKGCDLTAHPCAMVAQGQAIGCDLVAHDQGGCDLRSQAFVQWCDLISHPCDPIAHPVKHPHPVEYAGDFDYLAGLSQYWHEQCYTPARPASPSSIDVFKQEADQEAARSETTDLQNRTRASVDDGPRNKFGGSLADDVTWLADQFDQYNIECGDRNIPAQVKATQRPFDDLDTWQTFIEDKLLDFSERPEPYGSQLVLRALRADGEGWLAKRTVLAAPPANIINFNQRRMPVGRIPTSPETMAKLEAIERGETVSTDRYRGNNRVELAELDEDDLAYLADWDARDRLEFGQ